MDGQEIRIDCADGISLVGHLWPSAEPATAVVIVNAATGVAARFYHAYARFLAAHGFHAITYDYRGIGQSRPEVLKGVVFRWRDWGEKDFDAVLHFAAEHFPHSPVFVVGHSIGGFLPGYAARAPRIRRMLTIGAQYAFWPDYRPAMRLRYLWKWHLVMPALTMTLGYFPGRRLGWLEDLPKGVALEWAFRGRLIERGYTPQEAADLRSRFSSVAAEILAVSVTDDDFATPSAMRRAASYYDGATIDKVMLEPKDAGRPEIGHFDLFRSRHENGFWLDTLLWLREGVNPWPHRRFD
ncbi:alpha/beta hydrolase family protein [Rhizobium glycinendophyticum]|uniref:Alpha/beta fold hydrolase n=1 Tax=Rhizobium glycinendophyticum TaxID=2589807 RepID=A0A504UJI5_9HYPH|nr:alpha/beta fold hydrolase [Rhizobium glycinendophyticum]TPP09456.1 alpha/beta fold hydrolase [Rhizobium glycinendophyticum]